MSLDTRIQPKAPPQFGCHSDLDKYRKTAPPPCNIQTSKEERACEGCKRKVGAGETAS